MHQGTTREGQLPSTASRNLIKAENCCIKEAQHERFPLSGDVHWKAQNQNSFIWTCFYRSTRIDMFGQICDHYLVAGSATNDILILCKEASFPDTPRKKCIAN